MSQTHQADESDLLKHFRQAVAEDIRTLALLQDQELTQEMVAQLRDYQFPENLGLHLKSPAGKAAVELMQKSIAALPPTVDETVLNDLAADFASIYLTGALHASPYESVWFTEERITRQEPMFQVREWYKKYELAAKNWQVRPDDHLVLQLEFIAYLMELDDNKETLQEAAQFLDEHLLRWAGQFSNQVAKHCATAFYAGLTGLMAQYLEEMRNILAELLETPRPPPEEIEARMNPKQEAAPIPVQFVPGYKPF